MDLAKIAEKIGAKLVNNPKLVEAIKKGLEKKRGYWTTPENVRYPQMIFGLWL